MDVEHEAQPPPRQPPQVIPASQPHADEFEDVWGEINDPIPPQAMGRPNPVQVHEEYEDPRFHQDESLNGGIGFLQKFREKNGAIDLPEFETDTWDEIVKQSRQKKKHVLFYLHDDQGDSCTIPDLTVIGNEVLHSVVGRDFIWFGLNVHQPDGMKVKRQLNIGETPYIAVLSFSNGNDPTILGSRSGDAITVENLIEMVDLSKTMEEAGVSLPPTRSSRLPSDPTNFPVVGERINPAPFPARSYEEESKMTAERRLKEQQEMEY